MTTTRATARPGRWVADFCLGWGFFTRLGPARQSTPAQLASTLPWAPAYGLLLGLLLAAPFALGLLQGQPLVQAWVWLGLNWWATRGLHWDGWADLADGWGSGAQGDAFWRIVKDSRCGAFGAMGLFLGLGGLMALAQALFAAEQLAVLIYAPVLGRLALVWLARAGRTLARPGLAMAFVAHAGTRSSALSTAFALAAGLWLLPPGTLLAALLLAGLGVAALIRLARRQAGINGDFLGAAIVWGELAACLAALLTLQP